MSGPALQNLPQTYLHVSWWMNVIANTTLRRWCSNDWLTDIFRVGRNIHFVFECYYVWLDDIAWLSRILTYNRPFFSRHRLENVSYALWQSSFCSHDIRYRQIKTTTSKRDVLCGSQSSQIMWDIGVGYVYQKRNALLFVYVLHGWRQN